ncbi:MAG: bacillithiol biosynthesis cysteine-adding enzyme BshC, partial [candidate division Zixibacteria bacterium]|nr:bacillithiol biosynthesis cysteine-adding enzyme BshC [candidate division Zixibacteria bacterium]
KIPGTSKLFSDFLYDFQKVEKFYAGDFRKDKNYLRVFKSIKDKKYQREYLSSILRKQNQIFGSGSEAFKNIELLQKSDSLVVFTGQQVGLFGGPLYTIYKAITTLKLAQALSFRFSRPFVPLFWLDSEDHDFEEVRSTCIVDKENQIKEIKYSPAKVSSGSPMYQVVLEEEITSCVELLKSSLHPSEFKDKVIQKLDEFYVKGETISNSIAKWMTTLLGKYGLVIVDAGDKELKKLAVDLFLKEIKNPGKSMKLVKETGEKLGSSGYHQQVIKPEEMINLFLEVEGRRSSLKWSGDLIELEGSDRKMTREEFNQIIENEPQRLSPNVLLLPLMRSHLFPTAVYIGGPGEISYYAQLKSVFEFYDIPIPIVYPRASLSLIEDKVRQVFQKYSLDFIDLFQDTEILINSILKDKFPNPLDKILEEKREQIRESLNELENKLISSDPILKPNLENTRGKIDYELKRLGEKLFQVHRQKNQLLKGRIYKAKNNLLPENKLQERVLNLLPFLVKYGFEFVDILYQKTEIEKIDHQLLEVG